MFIYNGRIENVRKYIIGEQPRKTSTEYNKNKL